MADNLVMGDGPAPAHSPTDDAAMLWHALYFASKSPVSIIDVSGRFIAANDILEQLLNVEPGTLAGRNLSQFFPDGMFEDRIEVIRRVATTGVPENLTGMTWGIDAQCAFRPLPTPVGGVPRVLHVVGPAGRDPHGVATTRLKHEDFGPLATLTERERGVLSLIGEGLSTAEIANRLHRSIKTIEWHRASLGVKLQATNRVELAQIAIRLGLVKNLPPTGHPRATAATQNSLDQRTAPN